MSVFESISDASTKAVDKSELYLKKSHEFYKLKIFQQLSISISMVFKAVAIGGALIIGVTFMAIAMAFYIGALLDNYALGFIIVGSLFVITAFILFLMRKFINTLVIQKLSKSFFKHDKGL